MRLLVLWVFCHFDVILINNNKIRKEVVRPLQAQTMVCLLNLVCPWVVHAPFWLQLVTTSSFSFFFFFFSYRWCDFELLHEFVTIPSQNSHPHLFIGNYELCLKFTFHYKLGNWWILLPLYHFGSTLLRTTNDNQFFFLMFSYGFQ